MDKKPVIRLYPKSPITEQQFSDYLLAAFREGGSEQYRLRAIDLVINGKLWFFESFRNIPDYMKTSLGRKVARYIAASALKGVDVINDLARKAGFDEFDKGYPVSFVEYITEDGVFKDRHGAD